jgi:DNA polymerase III epsilon subunit-like protein
MEFGLLQSATPIKLRELCQVLDTLALARELHPGQRNNLDALVQALWHRQLTPRSARRVA